MPFPLELRRMRSTPTPRNQGGGIKVALGSHQWQIDGENYKALLGLLRPLKPSLKKKKLFRVFEETPES